MSGQASTYTFAQLDTAAATPTSPRDVLHAARAEAEQIRADAFQQGREAGYAAGVSAAQSELSGLISALKSAADEVLDARTELEQTLTEQAAELGLSVAEQILTTTIAADGERVLDIVRGALRRLAERHRLTLIVSTIDLAAVTQAAPGIQAELGGIDHIDVQSDRRVAPGGCIVRSEVGEIDATITTQLERAREIVLASLAGDPAVDELSEDPSDDDH